MNPKVLFCLEYLSIDIEDADCLIIEYNDGDISPKAHILNESNKESLIEIDPVKFCQLFTFLTKINLTNGADYDSVYCNHRKLLFIRFVIPECLLQLEFEDETINYNMTEQIQESIRETFQIIGKDNIN